MASISVHCFRCQSAQVYDYFLPLKDHTVTATGYTRPLTITQSKDRKLGEKITEMVLNLAGVSNIAQTLNVRLNS